MRARVNPFQTGKATMATEFRLCDEDREKYGGPEWVTFDVSKLDEQPLDELEQLENQIIARAGVSMVVMMAAQFGQGTLLGRTIVAWIARQQAGLTEPALKDFNIRPRKLKMRPVKPTGDTNPPPSESSATLSAEEPSVQPETE